MKAAILVKSKTPLVVEEVIPPDELLPGQVFVEINYSGICGAQINEIDAVKGIDQYLPHLLGHEGVGVVLESGPGVTTVRKGDRVVLHWRPSAGIQSSPPKYRWGKRKVNAGWVTTFNSHAVISENRLTVIPDSLDSRTATLFGCAVTTAFGVVDNDAQLKIGQSVLIFGIGGVGLGIAQASSMKSGYPIVGVDVTEKKLKMGRSFGLTHTLSSNSADLDGRIREIVGPAGADVVIETTGNSRVIERAYNLTHPEGKTILVGVPKKGDNISIPSLPLHFNKVLTGSHGGESVPDKDIPRFVRLLDSGKLDFDGLITHEFPLNQVNDALEVFRSGEAGRIILNMK
jgi:S-(hydroxymethyl)glutathione dehydrogenase/alcohol dehydrogenase